MKYFTTFIFSFIYNRHPGMSAVRGLYLYNSLSEEFHYICLLICKTEINCMI